MCATFPCIFHSSLIFILAAQGLLAVCGLSSAALVLWQLVEYQFHNQGSNWIPLHWKTDSQPLDHQGSPSSFHFVHMLSL